MASTVAVTPNALARTLSSALRRTITAKAVRTVARDTLARFDKTKHPEYQGHSYSATEVASLRKTFAARTGRATVQPVRKAKTTRKASKPVAPVTVAS